MINPRTGATISTNNPTQQLDAYQRRLGLGQYAPPQRASFYGGAPGNPTGGNIPNSYGNDPTFGPGTFRQPGVPGYAAGLGQSGGNLLGVQGGGFSPQSPNFGGGNIPGSFGNDPTFGNNWGYGTGYQPNPIGGAAYQPRSGGIGGSTPFLSGIQQQLGQMFGQTPGLGFRPQQQPQQALPQQQSNPYPIRSGNAYGPSGGSMSGIPQSTYGTGYDGSVPLRTQLAIPAGASSLMKSGYAALNNLVRS